MEISIVFSILGGISALIFALQSLFSKRRNLSKFTFAFGMIALAAEQFLSLYSQQAETPERQANALRIQYIATAFLPGFWILFSITYARGNIASLIKKRILLILGSFLFPLVLATYFSDGLVFIDYGHPVYGSPKIHLGWSSFLIHIIIIVTMIAALVGIERTYRASVGTLRWRIKFMLYGFATLFAARFYTSSQTVLNLEYHPTFSAIDSTAFLISCLLIGRSLVRKGTFEIELYPSRSVISGSLIISLSGIYLITVGLLSKLVKSISGDQASTLNTLLILLSLVGLGLAFQSDRARQLVRRFVSRNFQRPLYDYRTLWLKIASATSQSVRVKDICESTSRLLSNLLDTKLTSIWVIDTEAQFFELISSSDSQESKNDASLNQKKIDCSEIKTELEKSPDPINLDKSTKSWIKPILDCSQNAFDDGGDRILVPLVGNNTGVGFIILGDRTNTLRFTQQEFDTLRCIADHIAGSILSAKLTEKLEHNKEIEAFQTMATFFVHDLKNAVSTLNLMLKNMPLHWDNPEFREDALRGLGSTSNRITDLITRLGQVRSELEIRPSTITLSQLVEDALTQWETPPNIDFTKLINSDASIKGDKEKLISVILNLLINASEATNGEGTIQLAVDTSESIASLSVSDNGIGMSEEFIRTSLFRPFKTTKNNGLGIGMFQSKMIIASHGGSILVSSKQGKGSVFTIKLPIGKAEQ